MISSVPKLDRRADWRVDLLNPPGDFVEPLQRGGIEHQILGKRW